MRSNKRAPEEDTGGTRVSTAEVSSVGGSATARRSFLARLGIGATVAALAAEGYAFLRSLRDLSINILIFIRFPPHFEHDSVPGGKLNLSLGQKSVPEILGRSLAATSSFLTSPFESWHGIQDLSSWKRFPRFFVELLPLSFPADIKFSFFS